MLYFVVSFVKQITLCVVMFFYRQKSVSCVLCKNTGMIGFLCIGGLGYLIVKTIKSPSYI